MHSSYQYLDQEAVEHAMDEQCYKYYTQEYCATTKLPIVTVADSFYPGAYQTDSDLTLITVDQVLFYLNIEIVCRYSHNAFQPLIETADVFAEGERLAQIPETSEVVDAMAHFLYELPYSNYTPPLRIFIDALQAMSKYDIDASAYLVPDNPCYKIILAFTPLFPLEVYALAARFNVMHLARAASSYLLSISITDIPDDMASSIGSVYLMLLLRLHTNRVVELKRVLVPGPYPHAPTKTCSFDDQRSFTRAWYLVAAQLVWDSKPDISAGAVTQSFSSLEDLLQCQLCKEALRVRIKQVVGQWVLVKRMV